MAININDLIKSIKDGIINLAKTSLKDYIKEAGDDAEDFLERAKENLTTWTQQLETGELSKKDFEWLIKSKAELLEMVGLKHAGIAKIKLDEFRKGALDILRDTVFKAVGI